MNRSGRRKPDSRLPRWTWAVVVAGGILAYVCVGVLLEGPRFWAGIERFWASPAAFVTDDTETRSPYVLLLVPAVLGGFWTRENLGVVFRGLRRGDDPVTIAKDVALYALSFVVLILVGLTTSSKAIHH